MGRPVASPMSPLIGGQGCAIRSPSTSPSSQRRRRFPFYPIPRCPPGQPSRERSGAEAVQAFLARARTPFAGGDRCEGRFRALVLQKLHVSHRRGREGGSRVARFACLKSRYIRLPKKEGGPSRGAPRASIPAAHGRRRRRRRSGKFMAETRVRAQSLQTRRRFHVMHDAKEWKGTNGVDREEEMWRMGHTTPTMAPEDEERMTEAREGGREGGRPPFIHLIPFLPSVPSSSPSSSSSSSCH